MKRFIINSLFFGIPIGFLFLWDSVYKNYLTKFFVGFLCGVMIALLIVLLNKIRNI
jgi:hypothetical protein